MWLELISSIIGLLGVFLGLYFVYRVLFGKLLISKPKANIKPVSKIALRKAILKLNKKNPFRIIQSKEHDLTVKWVVADAKWIEVLGKGWHNLKYTAEIFLDDKNKTLKYSGKLVQKDRSLGVVKLDSNQTFTTGMLINTRIKKYQYGIKTDGSIGEVLKYDFSPEDIKGVIRQIANSKGWTFEVYSFKSRLNK